MLTHPHAKPEKVGVKDCTSILSGLRLVKESEAAGAEVFIAVAGLLTSIVMLRSNAFNRATAYAGMLAANP
jgi:hypothetical protein